MIVFGKRKFRPFVENILILTSRKIIAYNRNS